MQVHVCNVDIFVHSQQMVAYVGEYYPVTYQQTGRYVSCTISAVVVHSFVLTRYPILVAPSVSTFHMTFVCTLA